MLHFSSKIRARILLLLCLCLLPVPALAGKKPTPAPTAIPEPTMTPPPIAEEVPEQIAKMIRAAQIEIATVNKAKLSRSNKYTKWHYNDNRAVGWCGNFFSWCANEGGLEAVKFKKTEGYLFTDEVTDDMIVYAKEAAVPKAQGAYRNMNRFTDVPRPGYEIIYGVIGGTSSTHIGMVESVTEIGEGVYELTTLEGNVSNTVKRYCYRYIVNPKVKYQNFRAVPEAEQTRDDAQYELHKENWFITGFGQTWK